MSQYLSYLSNDHLLQCIRNLFDAYQRAKSNTSKKTFYRNKVDTFKLTFDARFNHIDPETLIETEIARQIDKSINNAIGEFHEAILGGIKGYESGHLKNWDVRAQDNSLFADVKNKHNTMNSSAAESLFQKLKNLADTHKHAKCYWVQILAKDSFCELWQGDINGKEYSHSRVYKISGDRFYALLSREEDALFQLYHTLPAAIDEMLSSLSTEEQQHQQTAIEEIKALAQGRGLLDQITRENYPYYQGFDRL